MKQTPLQPGNEVKLAFGSIQDKVRPDSPEQYGKQFLEI